MSDEAWEREVERHEKQLRGPVRAGELTARAGARGLTVRTASFHRHFGKPEGAIPEDLRRFRALPDEQAEEMVRERALLDPRAMPWSGVLGAWPSTASTRRNS